MDPFPLRVRRINFLTRRGAQALHYISPGTKDYCAEDIDHEVERCIKLFGFTAIALKEHCNSAYQGEA